MHYIPELCLGLWTAAVYQNLTYSGIISYQCKNLSYHGCGSLADPLQWILNVAYGLGVAWQGICTSAATAILSSANEFTPLLCCSTIHCRPPSVWYEGPDLDISAWSARASILCLSSCTSAAPLGSPLVAPFHPILVHATGILLPPLLLSAWVGCACFQGRHLCAAAS